LPEPDARSLRALDILNFCNAGIQTGLGPFMSIYYTAVRHWDPARIGVLIACQSLTGIAVHLLQGAVQSAMGLGGMLSNSLFGFVAKAAGFNASFGGLVALAAIGGVLYQWLMPETKPDDAQQE
jgi:hypothetical protein